MDERYVNVPVPVEDLEAVLDLLRRRGASETAVGFRSSPTSVVTYRTSPARSEKTREEPLKATWEAAPPILRRTLSYLSERPDRWISMAELQETVNEPNAAKRLGGALSGLSRRIASTGEGIWPMELRKNSRTRQSEYLMRGEVADILRKVGGVSK